MLVIIGGGLFTKPTVKVCAFDVPPPGAGLNTVTLNDPALVRLEAGIVAVSWVALTKVVVLFDPCHLTTDEEINPVPVTVKVSCGLPGVFEAGEMLEMAGTGLLTVRVREPD